MKYENSDTTIISDNCENNNWELPDDPFNEKQQVKVKDLRNPRYKNNKDITEGTIERYTEVFTFSPILASFYPTKQDGEVEVGVCPKTKLPFYRPIEECVEIEEGYYRLRDECYQNSDGNYCVYGEEELASNYRDIDAAIKDYTLFVLHNCENWDEPEVNYYQWCIETGFRPWNHVVSRVIKNNDPNIDQYNRNDGGGSKKDCQFEGTYNKRYNEPMNLRYLWTSETSEEDKVRLTIAALKGGNKLSDAEDLLNNPVRRNLLTGYIELNGEVIGDLGEERIRFLRRHGRALPINTFESTIGMLATDNEYNPVAEKLTDNFLRAVDETFISTLDYSSSRVKQFEEVKRAIVRNRTSGFNTSYSKLFPKMELNLEDLEEFIINTWGVTDEWYIEAIIHFMLSAVARAFDPGCKVDTVTIFKSGQGYNKSSALGLLAYDWYVSKRGTSISNKDDIMESTLAWIEEYAEIERITCSRDAAITKAHFSREKDTYRKPYSKVSRSYPRHWVIVGTTNSEDLFLDVDNRRYNVIELDQPVDLKYLKQYRDEAWALAVKLYLEGAKWWYSEDEEGANVRRERNKEYMFKDERSDAIFSLINPSIKYIDSMCLARILDGRNPDDTLHTPSKATTKEAKLLLQKSGWQAIKDAGMKKVTVPDGRRCKAAYINPNYKDDEERASKRRESYNS